MFSLPFFICLVRWVISKLLLSFLPFCWLTVARLLPYYTSLPKFLYCFLSLTLNTLKNGDLSGLLFIVFTLPFHLACTTCSLKSMYLYRLPNLCLSHSLSDLLFQTHCLTFLYHLPSDLSGHIDKAVWTYRWTFDSWNYVKDCERTLEASFTIPLSVTLFSFPFCIIQNYVSRMELLKIICQI